ncbi:MAG: AAA family ATPase [Pseudomonadota bacterium]|nr:AAA family ATPase [Pseudomonadota bacterium]
MTAGAARFPDKLDGYDIGPLLRGGPRFLIFRGIELASGRAVVLKINRDPYPSDRALAAQQRAYDIARVLVTEDFGAESLDRCMREHGRLEPKTALEIGVALGRALVELHRKSVVHKDIKPSNILWNPERRLLKLNDLELCSRLQQESVQIEQEALGPGTPAYIAPEQTGRMNRPVDLRADLYATGITLYELFAGVPPFVSDDPKELIHAHLARQPPDLGNMGGLHPSVAAIVAKLLQKNPEARYAAADGFASDLQRCLDDVQTGSPALFPLGSRDSWGRFAMPDRLYGREAEIRTLVDAVGAAGDGHRQGLLVAGYSGVGKTSLIAEVQLPIAARHGWFCPGKFDQFRRDLPYLAWREALASLTRQVLAQSEAQLSILRAELDRSLAGNGALIAELIPGLDVLLGEQKAPPAVGPAEAQARFDHAFRTFLRVLAQEEHPVVLFVDDLQWADLASLQLFESLVSDPSPAHAARQGSAKHEARSPR